MTETWPSSHYLILQNLFQDVEAPPIIDNATSVCYNVNETIACDIGFVSGVELQAPELIPTCIVAAIIGFTSFNKIRQCKNSLGHGVYSLSFLLFGIMMSDAAFNDCYLPNNPVNNLFWAFFFPVLDVGLTSCVGLSFLFNGLVDVGWINESSTGTKATMAVSFISLFVAWIWAFINRSYTAFLYLYVYVIAFSCGAYCIMETIYLIRSKDYRSLAWVGVAGVSGGIGLSAIYFPAIQLYMCTHFGCHVGGDFLWFVLTDVAMYSLYRYYMCRVTQKQKKVDDKVYLSLQQVS